MKKNKPQVEVYRCEKCKFQTSFIPGQQVVKKCKVCGNDMILYYTRDYNPQNGLKAIKDSNKQEKNIQSITSSPIVECPYCHSTNTHKISGLGRAASIGFWGIFSKKIGKQWHCDNCKSDF